MTETYTNIMEFRDLKRQYNVLKEEIDAAMIDVAASSAYIMGPSVKALEKSLADYTGTRHCITCANGTDALTIALKVWGIGSGDAVFVPDFTFFSSAEVVSLEGAVPVFVDVDEKTFNLNPDDLECKIQRTLKEGKLTPRVIIGVDLFGLPAPWPRIKEIAERYGLLTLEDGAQGFGGEINSRKACSFGDISTTSFFPAKPLGCYGDGGAIFTDNAEWAALADSYRVHGKGSYKYDNVRIGLNSRLDTIQAAILAVKLRAFEQTELRAVNVAAAKYDERLRGIVAIPEIPEGYLSSFAQYTIRLHDSAERDALKAFLSERGIPAMIYYPRTMHDQTAYASMRREGVDCPVAAKLCETVLSLPIHPYITDEEINLVADAVADFHGRKA